ncbi:MAG: GGDEF domain-containing protein [Treponema sp.]|nr:GGDEF domain-containing protein [Treponema sp.]
MIQDKRDSLTGVYERFTTEDFARTLVQNNRPFSIMLIDGDNFKNINDGYGHSVGDKVIALMAEKLKAAYKDKAFVGRFGGDEFMIIAPDIVEYDELWQTCHDAYDQFENFVIPEYPSIFLTITTGAARFPKDGATYEDLFEKADKALYRGKQKGRSCFIIYLEEKHKDIKIHSSDSPTANSMQMHNTIFTILSKSKDLKQTLPYLLQFFTTTLMIDHMGIQGKESLLFSEVYSLSKVKDFSYIDNALIAGNVNKATSVFYLNDVKQLFAIHQDALIKACEEQQLISMCCVEISYGGKFYGYLRADATLTFRIWQHTDMDLILTAAKAIAMVLYFQGKTLEDLV